MKINSNDYLDKEYDIEESVPQLTWMVAEGYEQKQIGTMMAKAEEVIFAPIKENLTIWRSGDQSS